MISLQHTTWENREMQILVDGFLRPSYRTGIYGIYGEEYGFSKWIYTRINTDIDKKDSFGFNLLIDPEVLLSTKFILHIGWKPEESIKKEDIIDGTKLTKSKLKKILENFKKQCILAYEMRELLGEKNMNSASSNEILIKDDVDLHKYLSDYRTSDNGIIQYMKKHYPKVKIITPK